MKSKPRLPKLRYFILAAVILAILASAFIYILNVAQTYTVTMVLYNDTVDENKLSYKLEDDSVVRVTSVNIENAEDGVYNIKFAVEGLKPGQTDFFASYQKTADTAINEFSHVVVTPLGIIFDPIYDRFTGCEVLLPMTMAIMLAVVVVLCMSFVEKYRAGSFSYGMIATGGFILYLTCNFLLCLSALIMAMTGAASNMGSVKDLETLMTGCGMVFAAVCFPVVLILAIAVSISNIQLVRHEGLRPVNLLGIALGFVFIAGTVIVWFAFSRDFSGSELDGIIFSSVNAVLQYAFCYLECMLLSTIICSVLATRYKVAPDLDYIIILGCAIRSDGTPTPILRGRIDRAVQFEREQYERTGKHAKFVPSGGQGSDEVISEAESMKRYLIEQGVPEDRILSEEKSVNTLQNMQFSKQVIEKDAGDLGDKKIAFSTTNYHVFRGYILARKVGMRVHGLSAKTKLYFFPNAFVREFIGLLWEEKFKHIIFMLLVILIQVGLIIVINI